MTAALPPTLTTLFDRITAVGGVIEEDRSNAGNPNGGLYAVFLPHRTAGGGTQRVRVGLVGFYRRGNGQILLTPGIPALGRRVASIRPA